MHFGCFWCNNQFLRIHCFVYINIDYPQHQWLYKEKRMQKIHLFSKTILLKCSFEKKRIILLNKNVPWCRPLSSCWYRRITGWYPSKLYLRRNNPIDSKQMCYAVKSWERHDPENFRTDTPWLRGLYGTKILLQARMATTRSSTSI